MKTKSPTRAERQKAVDLAELVSRLKESGRVVGYYLDPAWNETLLLLVADSRAMGLRPNERAVAEAYEAILADEARAAEGESPTKPRRPDRR